MGVLDIINRVGANFLVGSKNINGYAMKLLVLFLIISFFGGCSGGSQKTAIQGDIVEILIDPENFSVDLDLSEILDIQNKVSRDAEKGFIWILSTCVLLIPDYNFKLINYE